MNEQLQANGDRARCIFNNTTSSKFRGVSNHATRGIVNFSARHKDRVVNTQASRHACCHQKCTCHVPYIELVTCTLPSPETNRCTFAKELMCPHSQSGLSLGFQETPPTEKSKGPADPLHKRLNRFSCAKRAVLRAFGPVLEPKGCFMQTYINKKTPRKVDYRKEKHRRSLRPPNQPKIIYGRHWGVIRRAMI